MQTRAPPQFPNGFPWWYKANATCAFHQGGAGHDIENCYPLKSEVQKLVRSGILSFKDVGPNVQQNLLTQHGNPTVNMVSGYPGEYRVFNVRMDQR